MTERLFLKHSQAPAGASPRGTKQLAQRRRWIHIAEAIHRTRKGNVNCALWASDLCRNGSSQTSAQRRWALFLVIGIERHARGEAPPAKLRQMTVSGSMWWSCTICTCTT